ncbi:MAG TPA: adenylate/guanylate cyclase domain-containing protein [Acidimicrobiales bacterium]|nr:adenylate/guanylate cyclase domain-containing protein [Acidimicrobiales bacterium]
MGSLETFSAWFWRQFRNRFWLAISVLGVFSLSVVILGPLVFIVGPAFGLTRGEAILWSGLADLGGILATAIGIGSCLAIRRPIRSWIDGDFTHAREARDAVLVAGESMAMRGGVLGAPFMLIVVAPLFAHYAGFGTLGYATVEAMGMIALSLAAFLMANGLRVLLFPMLEEVAPHIEIDVRPTRRTWSLKTIFSVSTYLSAVATGAIAACVAQYFDDTREHAVFAGVLVAALLGAYGTAINRISMVEPTMRPLQDLRRATERVSEGNFAEPMAVVSTDEFAEVALAFNQMMVGLQQRESLHAAFGSYVDPALTRRLLTQDSSVFAGEAVDATVFFADVRGFTAYSETVEPEEAVAQLNRLFDIVVPKIREAGGHPNRFIGDGVFAVFGTPEALPDHANLACLAAVNIQNEVRRHFGDTLRLGIGINTGKVIAGTIGGGGKLDFTVIGDAVNIASRVEELTKSTGDAILVTQQTLDRAWSVSGSALVRGAHILRGRAAPTHVYAIET